MEAGVTDWVQVVADLATSWRFLALGVLLSLLICLAWVWSMRWTAGCLVRHYIYIYTIYIYTINIYTVSTLYLHYIYTISGVGQHARHHGRAHLRYQQRIHQVPGVDTLITEKA